jgi:hypothetical protein
MIRLLGGLLLLLQITWGGPGFAATPVQDERLIIVSFADRGINAAPAGAPGDFYTPGPVGVAGGYATTAWSRRLTRRLARDYQLELVTDWPIQSLGVHCAVFRVGGTGPIEDMMRRLGEDARVDGVQRLNTFRVLGAHREAPGAGLGALELDAAHRLSTGRNVRVAVVDTGIDVHHPDLAGQIVEMKDLVSDAQGDHDDVHGTAVAGIIAALADNQQGIVGVAPGAKLMSLRACWPQGPADPGAVCNSLTLARALDVVTRLKPDVLNLSLAGPADPLLNALLAAVLDAGVVVVAAAPAEDGEGVAFPTADERVIRVETTGAGGTGYRAVRAPGQDVLTTFPHGGYDFISGSSFAAAHVSGVVALLLEMHPGMPATEVRELLLDSSQDFQRTVPAGERQGGAPRRGLRAANDEPTCALMTHLGHGAVCAQPDAPPLRRAPLVREQAS